jgi:hypothetical protein
MIIFIKLGQVRALAIEVNKGLGSRPFFQKKTFHHETILDIPYAQITYTAGNWYPRKTFSLNKNNKYTSRSASNGNQQTHKTRKRAG